MKLLNQTYKQLLYTIDIMAQNNELPPSVLIYCDSFILIEKLLIEVTKKLLPLYSFCSKINCYSLRPEGKFRRIKIEDVRWLIDQIESKRGNRNIMQKTIVIIHSFDCLNQISINTILKVLSNPPENTILILSTCLIHRISPSILSRCYSFRLLSNKQKNESSSHDLKIIYKDWLNDIKINYNSRSKLILKIYSLIYFFEQNCHGISIESYDQNYKTTFSLISKEEIKAVRSEIYLHLYRKIFNEIASATYTFSLKIFEKDCSRTLSLATKHLSTLIKLLEEDNSPLVLLESFLLRSLDLWIQLFK